MNNELFKRKQNIKQKGKTKIGLANYGNTAEVSVF